MKIEDLKLGIKVKIPKTKLGQEEYNSAVVKMVKKISQDHLFYTGMDESSYCLSETYNGEVSGDYFYLDEIEPYFELPEKWCVKDCKEVTAYGQKRFGHPGDTVWPDRWLCVDENHWRTGKVDYSYKSIHHEDEYTEITLEQFKEYILKGIIMENKTIIGYKLIKPEYKEASIAIVKPFSDSSYENWESNVIKHSWSFTTTSIHVNILKKAGVLDLWFEPVYEEEYKVGDWVTITEIEGTGWLNCTTQKTFKLERIPSSYCGGNYWGVNGLQGLHAKFRKATPEEIQQAQKTIVKMYSSNKGEFEIEVVDGKAWYRKEGKLLPKQFIQDIINAFGEYGGILHPYKVEVKSVNVGCMEGTHKGDWERVYKLLK